MPATESHAGAAKRRSAKSNGATPDLTAQMGSVATNGFAMTAAVMSGMTTVGQELARFMALRAKHQADVAKALSKCANPVEAWTAYAEAATTMADDYSREMARISDVYSRVGSDVQSEIFEKMSSGESS